PAAHAGSEAAARAQRGPALPLRALRQALRHARHGRFHAPAPVRPQPVRRRGRLASPADVRRLPRHRHDGKPQGDDGGGSAAMNAPATLMLDDADLARADAYAVLAHLFFAPPQASVIEALRGARRDAGGDEVSAAWNALCAAAGDAGAIADEYAALFISVGKPEVSLYASWYLTGFLMEKPLA